VAESRTLIWSLVTEDKMTRSQAIRPDHLERYRLFLHVQAQRRLGPRLQGKLDASDLVQETLLHAHQKLGQFRGRTEAELAAWLHTILENTLAMAARRFQAGARDIARERPLQLGLGEMPTLRLARLPAASPSPDEHALRQEQLLRLAEALRKLPLNQFRAIQLRHLEGLSLDGVAQEMGKSKQAVVGLLFRGLRRLRGLLAEREGV
jgi:RNA polymerase sigma-70 factor (ECF subfamily)